MSVVNCQVQEGLCGPSFLRAGPTALPGPVVDEHGDLVFISSLRPQAARRLSFPSTSDLLRLVAWKYHENDAV